MVTGSKPDSSHSPGDSAHAPDLSKIETNRLAQLGEEHDVLVALGQSHTHEFVFLIHPAGNNSIRARMRECAQRGLFHVAATGGHDHLGPSLKIMHVQHVGHTIIGIHLNQIDNRFPFSSRSHFGDFPDLEPVEFPPGREDEHVAVRRSYEQVGNDVFLGPCRHSDAPFSASMLASVSAQRGSLDVAVPAGGDHHLFFGNQVLHGKIDLGLHDLSSAWTGVGSLNLY